MPLHLAMAFEMLAPEAVEGLAARYSWSCSVVVAGTGERLGWNTQ